VNAFIIGDVLNDLAYHTRPYELVEGATDRALEQALEYMAGAIERMPLFRLSRKGNERAKRTPFRQIEHAGIFFRQLVGRSLLDSLREARALFDTIEVDRSRVKPVVKITGEFWAQTTEGDGNFRMFQFLEQEGAEVLIEPITPWLLYLLHQEKQARRDRRLLDVPASRPGLKRMTGTLRSWLSWFRVHGILTLAERLYAREYRRCRKVLCDVPQALPDQYHFARIAEPYFNTRIEGGEGHLEVAKTIYYSREALCHMILSLKPFGCLPSTQSDGVQSAVVAHHKQLIFLPIETSGEGEANAQSRVQMSLADARERAKHEYDAALRITGLTPDDIQRAIASEEELRSPFFALPPDGRHAATSARFVFELARRRKERGE
jgi:predicted nucleotide-binding protein (sugar kinase/HSP70/actin superfamily)